MRFIDTNKRLQPHHGGIVAWRRTADEAYLHLHHPGTEQECDALASWVRGAITGIADFAYNSQGIDGGAPNRITPAYVRAMYDYMEAPNDSDRWGAFVVPHSATEEQLARTQADFARLWYTQSLSLQEKVEHAANQQDTYSPELITARILGALPTLHTVGFETDGPVGAPIAITGVWVPHVDQLPLL
ncbi:MAG TPA: hypothetical protein VLI54_04690 [Bacillota bacterium]|nr:hypothetical protein [Bacillota bacterium]